jgi:hypothetical protein
MSELVVIDDTYNYRLDQRTPEKFAQDLKSGFSYETRITQRLRDLISERHNAISLQAISQGLVNGEADVELSCGLKKLKIEIQHSKKTMIAYEDDMKVVHVKTPKIKKLQNFVGRDPKNYCGILVQGLKTESYIFNPNKADDMLDCFFVERTNSAFFNKACLVMPTTVLTTERLFDNQITDYLDWLSMD